MDNIRDKNRDIMEESRSQKRNQSFSLQRKALSNVKTHASYLTASQIEILAHDVKHKKKDIYCIQQLCNGLSQGDEAIRSFLKVDGALEALVSFLTGHDAELQFHAGNCLINLSSGSSKSALRLTKAVSSYLIAYLQSACPELQEISALTLGNLSYHGGKCCEILDGQGLLVTLIPLLKSAHEAVIDSAIYAIYCFTRNPTYKPKLQMETKHLLLNLMELLRSSSTFDIRFRCASIIFIFTCSKESQDFLFENGIVDCIVTVLQELLKLEAPDNKILMPLVRILGNLSCVDDSRIHNIAVPELTKCFVYLLQCSVLVKETLWVLSNLAASKGTSNFFYNGGIVPTIINLTNSFGNISNQALLCLCHLLHQDSSFIQELIDVGFLFKLAKLLRQPDAIQMSLILLTLINSQTDVQILESTGCLSALESLLLHKENNIQEAAIFLLNQHKLS